ncbi:hypothetical protein LINPERHAP1_LOCUS37852 [Linum perenne]
MGTFVMADTRTLNESCATRFMDAPSRPMLTSNQSIDSSRTSSSLNSS